MGFCYYQRFSIGTFFGSVHVAASLAVLPGHYKHSKWNNHDMSNDCHWLAKMSDALTQYFFSTIIGIVTTLFLFL